VPAQEVSVTAQASLCLYLSARHVEDAQASSLEPQLNTWRDLLRLGWSDEKNLASVP